jgi:CheY-like chemotaxis protein
MSDKAILLVEDTASDIGLTQRALRKHGIGNPLVIAEDGQEALDYLFCTGAHQDRDIKDTPMLILLDLKLPRIDGFEVLRQIRADRRTRPLPVVILSASGEKHDVAAGYDLGTNSYIRKPIDFYQFAEIVKQLGLYWLVTNEPPPVV